MLRDVVWGLSENTAGMYISFKTNAKNIKVRYGVSGSTSFPHMPATGVSGVDLYAHKDNTWYWLRDYSFKDAVSYAFKNIQPLSKSKREYRLYLPLYNKVEW